MQAQIQPTTHSLLINQSKEEAPPSKEEAPVAPKEDSIQSDIFKRVAKQEKHITEERKKIEEAKRAFEAEKHEAEKYKSLKNKDPFEILEHFGISYEALLEADKLRNSPIDPMTKKALDAVEQLKSELQDSKEKEKRERLSKAEMQLQSEIDKAIKEGEFDVIETLEAQHSVREYMEEIFDSTGEIPDIKEACKAVTEHIVELTRKIQKSKWLAPKEEKAEAPKETVKIHALSNKMTQTSVSQDRPLTDQERLKAAINAMELVRSK